MPVYPTRTSQVLKALRAAQPELSKGVLLGNSGSSMYWHGGIADKFFEQSIHVFRLGHLSVEHYVEDFMLKYEESKRKGNIGEAVSETLIEYAVRELFKGRQIPAVAKSVAKKFDGTNNAFLGGDVRVTAAELEDAIWDRVLASAMRAYALFKEGKKHMALDSAADQFKLNAANREELKRRMTEKLGDVFPVEESLTEGVHKYCSTQVNLPVDVAANVLIAGQRIPDEEIGAEGRDLTPHITVQYGLASSVSIEALKSVLGSVRGFPVTLGPLKLFPPSKHSGGDCPVWASVSEGEERLTSLRLAIRRAVGKENVTDNFPVYCPHVCVAYVKESHAKKYEGADWLTGERFIVDHVMFSDTDRNLTRIDLLPALSEAATDPVDISDTGVQSSEGEMIFGKVINGQKYIMTCTDLGDGEGSWLVEFVNASVVRRMGSSKASVSITGTGAAAQVMSWVVACLRHMLKEVKPHKLVYTAEEDSRQRLYAKIIHRLGMYATNIGNGEFEVRIPKNMRTESIVGRIDSVLEAGKFLDDEQIIRKTAKELKFPAGTKYYGSSAHWTKRGGYAGDKMASEIVRRAEAVGFVQQKSDDASSPDGSVMGTGSTWVKAGVFLNVSRQYGVTSRDNVFSASLQL